MDNLSSNNNNTQQPQSNSLFNNVSDITNSAANTASSTFDSLKNNVTNTFNQFESPTLVGTSNTSFMDSNSIIAKFVFFIFVVALFLFLCKIGIYFITKYTMPSTSPYIINGMVNGNVNMKISQNPNDPNSIEIRRSNNENKGLEATWSTWLNIDSLQSGSTNSYSHIFSKGNNVFNSNGIASINNAPGVYLKKGDSTSNDNTIRIIMDTVNGDSNNYIDVTNIPLKKWFHLAIRFENNLVDVYVNGVMAGRKTYINTLKQNYDNILIGQNGGFNGNLSNLLYSDHALTVFDLNNLLLKGPNLVQSGAVKSNLGFYSYLSNLWYYDKM